MLGAHVSDAIKNAVKTEAAPTDKDIENLAWELRKAVMDMEDCKAAKPPDMNAHTMQKVNGREMLVTDQKYLDWENRYAREAAHLDHASQVLIKAINDRHVAGDSVKDKKLNEILRKVAPLATALCEVKGSLPS